MMGYTHMACGCALWVGVRTLLPGPPGSLPPELALAALGSLLPDIDEPQSLLGRKLGFIAWPIKLVFGHRGFTHSLAALGLTRITLVTNHQAPKVVGLEAYGLTITGTKPIAE